jgi:hypothetical protein
VIQVCLSGKLDRIPIASSRLHFVGYGDASHLRRNSCELRSAGECSRPVQCRTTGPRDAWSGPSSTALALLLSPSMAVTHVAIICCMTCDGLANSLSIQPQVCSILGAYKTQNLRQIPLRISCNYRHINSPTESNERYTKLVAIFKF